MCWLTCNCVEILIIHDAHKSKWIYVYQTCLRICFYHNCKAVSLFVHPDVQKFGRNQEAEISFTVVTNHERLKVSQHKWTNIIIYGRNNTTMKNFWFWRQNFATISWPLLHDSTTPKYRIFVFMHTVPTDLIIILFPVTLFSQQLAQQCALHLNWNVFVL